MNDHRCGKYESEPLKPPHWRFAESGIPRTVIKKIDRLDKLAWPRTLKSANHR
jgi:hypothetical protein